MRGGERSRMGGERMRAEEMWVVEAGIVQGRVK
jgi:hypothetical protein